MLCSVSGRNPDPRYFWLFPSLILSRNIPENKRPGLEYLFARVLMGTCPLCMVPRPGLQVTVPPHALSLFLLVVIKQKPRVPQDVPAALLALSGTESTTRPGKLPPRRRFTARFTLQHPEWVLEKKIYRLGDPKSNQMNSAKLLEALGENTNEESKQRAPPDTFIRSRGLFQVMQTPVPLSPSQRPAGFHVQKHSQTESRCIDTETAHFA